MFYFYWEAWIGVWGEFTTGAGRKRRPFPGFSQSWKFHVVGVSRHYFRIWYFTRKFLGGGISVRAFY